MALEQRTCRLVTLGCKVNQYETQHVKETLEANGYREAAGHEAARLCIVNTCTVTAEADSKARQLVRQLHRDNPGAAVVVMGCYATRDQQTVARLPGVARVVTDKNRLVEELADFGVTHMPRGITRFDGHQRAFVKVQDGCLLNCTFCIIPSVRPAMRSRPAAEIVAEVRHLVDNGCQEIVLTGIHLGHYGIDLCRGKPKPEWTRLWHLIERLSALPGRFRIRLSSLEAAEVRDDLLRSLQGNPRICPHLHICLQSGSDAVLQRMKRRYRVASFLERCRQIRAAFDQPAITTDIIVGFPGETDGDFEATCRVAREAGFSQIHIFPFSARRGTPAATMPGQVPPRVLAERKVRLAALERELRAAYLRQMIGRRLEALVEGVDPRRPGHVVGTSCRRVPVVFPGDATLMRQLVPVWTEIVDGDQLGGYRLAASFDERSSANTIATGYKHNLPLIDPSQD
jgi:threonylcarbamoyladenosine tRNA methylthiotransferase MtaB